MKGPRGDVSLWRAILVFIACWLVLAWPWLSGAVTIPYDAKAQFLPQIQFLAHSLWNGESPFWTPYVFSGYPQIADPQSMIFSPPFFLLALFDPSPGLWSADVAVFLIIATGALGLLVWARDQGWHWGAGVLTALSFGFGAAMSWRIQHIGQVLSLAMLAVTLMLLSRALTRRSWGYGLAAGVSAGFMVLGRDQVALLGVYLLFGFVVWHWLSVTSKRRERFLSSLPPLAAGGIAGFAIVAIPILLTWLLAEASNRPEIDYIGAGRGSLHPALLVTFFAPDIFGASGAMGDYWGPPSFTWADTGLFVAQNMGILYIGALPVWLVLGGVFSGGLWRKDIRFFSVATIVMLIYALGWYTPGFRLAHDWLPGIDLFRRPADAVFLLGFLLSILAGHGADRLLSGKSAGSNKVAWLLSGITVVAAFAFAASLATHFDRWPVAAEPFVISATFIAGAGLVLILANLLRPLRPVFGAMLLIAFTVVDLGLQNGPNGATGLPPDHYDVLEEGSGNETIALLERLVRDGRSDTRRDRVELVGLGFHWPNASLTHGLENTVGYNPVRLALYSEATGAGDSSGSADQRKFSPLMPSYTSPMANLLGLRFIASGVPVQGVEQNPDAEALRLVARTSEAYVYENPNALPRVMFATQARLADFDLLISGGDMPEIDYRETVLLEAVPGDEAPPEARGSAAILAYRNDEIVVETNASHGGWLLLNEVWHPWWYATVDDQPAQILRANVLFRAVAVPRGRHTVRFTFRPLRGALKQMTGNN